MKILNLKNILIFFFTTIITLMISYLAYNLYQAYFPLYFTTTATEVPEIKINDTSIHIISPYNKKPIIAPVTFNTLYPNKIQVGSQIKYRKLKKLKNKHYIPLKIKLGNGQIKNYRISPLSPYIPKLTVNTNNYHKGFILTSVHGYIHLSPSYSIIMKPNGNIIWYRGNEKVDYSTCNLKQHRKNGKIRYSMHVHTADPFFRGEYLIMDEKFNVIDKVHLIKTKKHPELLADEHEFIYIDDGHYILNAAEDKKTYTNNIIQEQKNKKVVLDWVSDQHPEFFKKAFQFPNYLHVNSFVIDPKDNNIIFSGANGYLIAKINRQTGKTMWILGGRNDEFNNPQKYFFIRQHNVQIASDGDLLFFDNGNFDPIVNIGEYQKTVKTHLSRGLKYKLDEKNKKILNVEEFPFYDNSIFMGSIQLLKDNNTMFGCGGTEKCIAKILNQKGEILLNIEVQRPYFSYRSFWVESLK